jgi:hypothetical protein
MSMTHVTLYLEHPAEKISSVEVTRSFAVYDQIEVDTWEAEVLERWPGARVARIEIFGERGPLDERFRPEAGLR